MEKYHYFQHDCNARADDKVLQIRSICGTLGYAMHFMCLEVMNENEDGYIKKDLLDGLALSFSVSIAQLKLFISSAIAIGLYVENEHGFTTKRVQNFKKEIENYKNERKLSGAKGARIRWENSSPIADPKVSYSSPLAVHGKRKEKKRKNNPPNPLAGEFEKFWEQYPNKKAKPKAWNAFTNLKAEEVKKILEVLPQHNSQEQWQKEGGKFIPYPATWLNGRRWEDEIVAEKQDSHIVSNLPIW